MEEWKSNRPFSDLAQYVQNVPEIATDMYLPIDDQDIADAIYNIVFNNGLLYKYCNEYTTRHVIKNGPPSKHAS